MYSVPLCFVYYVQFTYFDTLSKDFDLPEGCNNVSTEIMEYVPNLKGSVTMINKCESHIASLLNGIWRNLWPNKQNIH